MCEDKAQNWISVNAAVMIGIISGVIGNLFVTSGFETAHYYNWLPVSIINPIPTVALIFGGSTLFLIIIACLIGYNLRNHLG
jgi:hypothetical protein